MSILTSSQELIGLIKNVYALFHIEEADISQSDLNSLHQFIPSIREQLQVKFSSVCLLSDGVKNIVRAPCNFSFIFLDDYRIGRMAYVIAELMDHSCMKTGTRTCIFSVMEKMVGNIYYRFHLLCSLLMVLSLF